MLQREDYGQVLVSALNSTRCILCGFDNLQRASGLEGFLREADRKIDDVRVVVCPYGHPEGYDEVCRYLDAGAGQVVLNAARTDGDSLLAHLDALADQVVARVAR